MVDLFVSRYGLPRLRISVFRRLYVSAFRAWCLIESGTLTFKLSLILNICFLNLFAMYLSYLRILVCSNPLSSCLASFKSTEWETRWIFFLTKFYPSGKSLTTFPAIKSSKGRETWDWPLMWRFLVVISFVSREVIITGDFSNSVCFSYTETSLLN